MGALDHAGVRAAPRARRRAADAHHRARRSGRLTVLDPDLQELARSVRAQAWRALAGRAAELDRAQRFDPQVWAAVRDLGIIPLPFAEDDGGAGGSALALVVALEQVAYACAVAAVYPGTTIQVIRALLDHAQPALRAR